MACVSSNVRRTFHVPSGVRVQRSISKRDFSHPGGVEFEKAETTSTSTNSRTTCAKSLALFVSSDSFLSAFSHILKYSCKYFANPFSSFVNGVMAFAMFFNSSIPFFIATPCPAYSIISKSLSSSPKARIFSCLIP